MGVHLGVCGLIPSHFLKLPKVWMWLPGFIFALYFSMPLLWSRGQTKVMTKAMSLTTNNLSKFIQYKVWCDACISITSLIQSCVKWGRIPFRFLYVHTKRYLYSFISYFVESTTKGSKLAFNFTICGLSWIPKSKGWI